MANLEKRVADLEEIVNILKGDSNIFRMEMNRDERIAHEKLIQKKAKEAREAKQAKNKEDQKERRRKLGKE